MQHLKLPRSGCKSDAAVAEGFIEEAWVVGIRRSSGEHSGF
jgi:hypothetical protein